MPPSWQVLAAGEPFANASSYVMHAHEGGIAAADEEHALSLLETYKEDPETFGHVRCRPQI